MKFLAASLLAFAATAIAAPHISPAHVIGRFSFNGPPAVWVTAPKDPFIPGQGVPSYPFMDPRHGIRMTPHEKLPQLFQDMVRSAIKRHNALRKNLVFTPAVNRFHTGYAAAGAYTAKGPVRPFSLPFVPRAISSTASSTSTSSPSTSFTSTSSPSTSTSLRPPSLEGDTAVNYVGAVPRANPDAEVFDENLVREDARRHFAASASPDSAESPEAAETQP